MTLKRIALIALFAAAQPANAEPGGVYCTGTIAGLTTDHNGYLSVSMNAANGRWYMLCNVGSPWKGISPQTCVTWAAKLTSVVLTNKPISIYYHADPQPVCTTIPEYSASPPPYTVMLLP